MRWRVRSSHPAPEKSCPQYGDPMKLGPGLSFSWKRALGVTSFKRKIAKATGIPTTRSGRQAKLGRIFKIR